MTNLRRSPRSAVSFVSPLNLAFTPAVFFFRCGSPFALGGSDSAAPVHPRRPSSMAAAECVKKGARSLAIRDAAGMGGEISLPLCPQGPACTFR